MGQIPAGVFGSATLSLEGPSGDVHLDVKPGRLTLGRTPDNDVVLPDPAASSHHADIYSDGKGLYLRDLGSSNGTYVNGEPIKEVPLFDGDLVRIGQSQGRISVLQSNGRALRRPASRLPLVALVGVLLLIAVGLVAVRKVLLRRNAEREIFEGYQQQAHELLAGASLCQAVSSTRIEVLRTLDAKTAHPALGDHGHLKQEERAADAELVVPSRARALQTKQDTALVTSAIEHRSQTAGKLRSFDDRFTDPSLANAVHAIDLLLAQQQEIAQEYLKSWQDMSTDASEFQTQLEALLSGPEDRSRTAAERLDALVIRGHPDPAKAQETCESAYRQTIDKGISQLTQIGH